MDETGYVWPFNVQRSALRSGVGLAHEVFKTTLWTAARVSVFRLWIEQMEALQESRPVSRPNARVTFLIKLQAPVAPLVVCLLARLRRWISDGTSDLAGKLAVHTRCGGQHLHGHRYLGEREVEIQIHRKFRKSSE